MPSPRRASLTLLTLAGVFLVVAILVVAVTRRSRQDAARWVDHTYEVRLELAGLRALLVGLELDVERGGDARMGARRIAARARAIRELTHDNPDQRERLDALDVTLDAIRRGAAPEASTAAIRDADGLVAVMDAEEAALLTVRIGEEHRRSVEVWTGLALSLGLSVAFAFSALRRLGRQERELGRQIGFLASVLESSGDAVVAVSAERTVLVANRAFRDLVPEGAVGSPLDLDWIARADARTDDARLLPREGGPLVRALGGERVDDFRYSFLVPGRPGRIWVSATTRPVVDSSGKVVAAVGVLRDVTEARAREELVTRQTEQIRQQSLVDELTGLYNRRGFTLLSEQYVRTARRTARPFAILFADLDGLKAINDGLGHDAGDQAIRKVATLLKATARESDIVARLGGDEYVVLIDGADEPAARQFGERFTEALALEAVRDPQPYTLAVSIGYSCAEEGAGRSLDELVADADRAMYAQKKGRSVRPPSTRR